MKIRRSITLFERTWRDNWFFKLGLNLIFRYFKFQCLKFRLKFKLKKRVANKFYELTFLLTLSWRRPLLYRNQSIDLQSKSMDWFLYDNGLRRERVRRITVLRLLCFFWVQLAIVAWLVHSQIFDKIISFRKNVLNL